jgi:hypothetical protein
LSLGAAAVFAIACREYVWKIEKRKEKRAGAAGHGELRTCSSGHCGGRFSPRKSQRRGFRPFLPARAFRCGRTRWTPRSAGAADVAAWLVWLEQIRARLALPAGMDRGGAQRRSGAGHAPQPPAEHRMMERGVRARTGGRSEPERGNKRMRPGDPPRTAGRACYSQRGQPGAELRARGRRARRPTNPEECSADAATRPAERAREQRRRRGCTTKGAGRDSGARRARRGCQHRRWPCAAMMASGVPGSRHRSWSASTLDTVARRW